MFARIDLPTASRPAIIPLAIPSEFLNASANTDGSCTKDFRLSKNMVTKSVSVKLLRFVIKVDTIVVILLKIAPKEAAIVDAFVVSKFRRFESKSLLLPLLALD